ncbi:MULTISPECIES: 1-aminocyclopropane-1-carboxylate deaminase/D-cysteine desulfhydrase [Myroides]|uniref:1-aminocyclopropane-1-carboxylate deaminase/D-cysteine desulfhydrase n=1 Tax=Myroides TaxID=76831 RepID=UPI00130347E8|nr:pyridoxal-phosphate dependent enzyme [Myroides phaeus]
MFDNENVYNQHIAIELPYDIELYIKREDLLHKEVSGNKFRKLKYNIAKAKELGYNKLLTFGGAYSNHIAATAAAGRICGIDTIGIIRGEELATKYKDNHTLSKAVDDGMELGFLSRSDYRLKSEEEVINRLRIQYGDFYLVPEGGTNSEAIRGTEEILKPTDCDFDYVCTAVGTGGTIAGIINSSQAHQTVLGFPALKGDFLYNDIKLYTDRTNWDLILDYHFGGYAKYTDELINFIKHFQEETGVLLDPIYTGKMMFGVIQKIKEGYFKEGSKILAIHTGGLQGWSSKIKN